MTVDFQKRKVQVRDGGHEGEAPTSAGKLVLGSVLPHLPLSSTSVWKPLSASLRYSYRHIHACLSPCSINCLTHFLLNSLQDKDSELFLFAWPVTFCLLLQHIINICRRATSFLDTLGGPVQAPLTPDGP